jgi:hypothetical protein
MYGTKVKPSHLIDESDFTIIYPAEGEDKDVTWNEPYYQIAALDPGKKNLALTFERRYKTGNIKVVECSSSLDQIGVSGGLKKGGDAEGTGTTIETLAHILVELDEHRKVEHQSAALGKPLKLRYDKTYLNIIKMIHHYKELFSQCHWILIEKQLTQNTDACIAMAVCLSTIISVVAESPIFPRVVLMSPMLKTRILAPGTKMDNRERKKWAVEYGKSLTQRAGDTNCFDMMTNPRKYVCSTGSWKKTTKCDDLFDTKCMIEAFCVIQGFPVTPERTGESLPNQQIPSSTLSAVRLS